QTLESDYIMEEFPGCTIISCDDWPLSSDTPSMRVYLVHLITSALLTFAGCLTVDETDSVQHGDTDDEEDRPRGCISDYWEESDELYMCMVSSRLCNECRSVYLAHGTPPESLHAIDKLLEWTRSVVLARERKLPRNVFIGHG